ncbi:chromosome segregation and condensation protein, ScpB [Thermodesulfatator indicus DSM 15286]|uniref:Chromosome segregation and condensation protein, ScpB n=1 Tax=Thermodesulfatator indicus (strain DSM 15286 / JCM 11887 / CIR29812) TaxID=667014 RepID=F8AAK8_THEID|nr:SMC-Scp complex subunit ScpB [Thermodesulfatator indicus]AEH44280.1 chromosome segregation and condensation protein, ScpB [Thermodesulfatator indicus DSM 15286]
MDRAQLERALEAVFLAAGRVVTIKELLKIFPDANQKELKEALNSLKTFYENRGFVLREVAGGFRFETKEEFAPLLRRLVFGAPPKLSRAALETLAIIAYKQPITKAEIESIRGVDSSGAIKNLMEKGLVKICGRKDVPGKPLLYGTTPKFLEIFGLKDLSELPKMKEIEKMLADE